MDNTHRDNQIAADFMSGIPVSKLALDYSLSIPSVNRILKEMNVDRSNRIKQAVDHHVVDHLHIAIGVRLYDHRTCEVGEERPDCADKLGWSSKKLAMIEQGKSVLNLADLKVIAEYMNMTLSQLVENL